MESWKRLLVGLSTVLVVVGAVASIAMHGPNPLLHPSPMLRLSPWLRESLSATLGIVFGVATVAATRWSVRHTRWARRLHRDLRPVAQQLSPGLIVLLALLSSAGEELLFRSFLTPWVGIVPQALVFGILHQTRGPSRWVWALWATVRGLAFGLMYAAIGSLIGPCIAHALINAINLRFLRDHEVPWDPIESR